MKSKSELMIASWPDRRIDIPAYEGSTCISHAVYFRMVDPDDKWTNDEARAANDIGLYVWCDIDGTVSIDVRAMEIHSANIREMELRLKLLKRLTTKAERAGFSFHTFKRDADVFEQLTRCVDALGIRQTVQYHGIGAQDTYAPVSIAIKRIADAVNDALSRQRQRRAA
jgi:hypothetical protein